MNIAKSGRGFDQRERAGARRTGGGWEAVGAAAVRLLAALAREDAFAFPDPGDPDRLVVRGESAGVSLAHGRHDAAAGAALAGRGLAVWGESRGGLRRLRIDPAGLSFLRRRAAARGDAFAAQHREVAEARLEPGGAEVVAVNAGESPLAWLRRRRGRDGAPLVGDAAFQAGERLRRDLTLAGMIPGVTMNWGGLGAGGGPGGPAEATDRMIAARQRVTHALQAVGPDLADLLYDLCGFLKGLATIERDRGWPARSAKVVLGLALDRLAAHYGLSPEARGPAAAHLRAWRAEEAPAGPEAVPVG